MFNYISERPEMKIFLNVWELKLDPSFLKYMVKYNHDVQTWINNIFILRTGVSVKWTVT
jgi:hypothetical protein